MNITQESTGELTATIKVHFTEEDYLDKVEKQLKEYQHKANMPGFRPGKVPFGMIKKMYGKAAIAEQIDKLLSDAVAKHIEDNKLQILGNPLPNVEKSPTLDLDEQKEFDFYFDLGLSPEIDPVLDDSVKISEYDITVDDAEIDEQLGHITKKFGNYINPEVSATGDMIAGDFAELDGEGNILENGISHNSSVFSEHIPTEEMKARFNGLKVGDQLTVNPRELVKNDYELNYLLGIKQAQNENLSSNFSFTVTQISRVEPASIDSELFVKVYPETPDMTEADFRKKIEEDIKANYKQESERKFLTDVQKALIDRCNLTLPDEFLKRYFLEVNEDEKLSPEKIIEDYDKTSDSLRWQLIENSILKKYEIKVVPEDAQEYVKEYFRKYKPQHTHEDGQDHTEADNEEEEKRLDMIAAQVLKNEKEARQIYQVLFDKKLMALYREKLSIETKKLSMKEFVEEAYKHA